MEKIMVKFVVLILIVATGSIAYCENYELNLNLNDGSTVTFVIDDIRKIEFTNVTGVEDEQIVQNFALMQNYPNPFNPETTIEYQIPAAGQVLVRIFNMKGQLINELVNELQTEGVHQVTWDGTDRNNSSVASGIYFYTIKSEDLFLSKKMILLK